MKLSPQKAAEANTRLIFIALSVISAISIIDVLGTRILNFAGPAYSIMTSVFAFILMFSIFLISWLIVLRLIAPFTPISSSNSSMRPLNLLYRILEISPFASSGFIVAIIFELLYNSSYHLFLIPLATITSYVPAIIILSVLILKLIRWFKSKHDYVMLSYTIAMSTILLNGILIIVNLPAEMEDYSAVRKASRIQDIITLIGIPHQLNPVAYQFTSFIAFVFTWFATALLLRHYSRKTGEIVYWVLVALPLLYFLGQQPPVFNYLFSAIRDSDPSLYAKLSVFFFGLTKTVGGIFFAIGFWGMARSVNNKTIKNYLRLSGYGILLIFVATQLSSILIGPYPPFGVIALSSMALASDLTFVGIYFTALSIAKETNLRIEISQKVKKLAMLGKIGTAQMEQDLLKQVKPIIEKHHEREDEIPTSLEEEDIRLFVRQALREVNKRNGH
jgi:hypothetical protein